MKTSLFYVFFLSLANLSFAQGAVNQHNSKGERTGVWKKYDHHKNLLFKGEYLDGKEVGTFFYYNPKNPKQLAIKKEFNESIATITFYNTKELIESKGKMSAKKRIGEWVYYNHLGKAIILKENYQNGLLQGISQSYFDSGNPLEIKHYKEGKLHGKKERFTEKGILLESLEYKNGKLNGETRFFNTYGQLLSSGIYKDNLKVGTWFYAEQKEEKKN